MMTPIDRTAHFAAGALTGICVAGVGALLLQASYRLFVDGWVRQDVEGRVIEDCEEEGLVKLHGVYYRCDLNQTETVHIERMEDGQ